MSSAATTLLYSGQQTDAATGLQYLRARYYRPDNGTFTTLDPFAGDMSTPVTFNKYLYSSADPANNYDPTGTDPRTEDALFGTDVHIFINKMFEGFETVPATNIVNANAPAWKRAHPKIGTNQVTNDLVWRWANRWVGTIVRDVMGANPIPINGFLAFLFGIRDRPDFSEWDKNPMVDSGEVYELKPASVSSFSNIAWNLALAYEEAGFYALQLSTLTTVDWDRGTHWIPGVVLWPTFHGKGMKAGQTLVTYNYY